MPGSWYESDIHLKVIEASNLLEAQKECNSRGGNMAQIKSEFDFSRMRRFTAMVERPLYIGLVNPGVTTCTDTSSCDGVLRQVDGTILQIQVR